MGKAVTQNVIKRVWKNMKEYVQNNRFDATGIEINAQTGHLIANQTSNLKFSLDSKGHLISEVK